MDEIEALPQPDDCEKHAGHHGAGFRCGHCVAEVLQSKLGAEQEGRAEEFRQFMEERKLRHALEVKLGGITERAHAARIALNNDQPDVAAQMLREITAPDVESEPCGQCERPVSVDAASCPYCGVEFATGNSGESE